MFIVKATEVSSKIIQRTSFNKFLPFSLLGYDDAKEAMPGNPYFDTFINVIYCLKFIIITDVFVTRHYFNFFNHSP